MGQPLLYIFYGKRNRTGFKETYILITTEISELSKLYFHYYFESSSNLFAIKMRVS
jgi:hypothetical protein